MGYVYLIGDYHEYGSQNLRVTLDRSRLIEFLAADDPDRELLAEQLKRPDEELADDCERAGLNLGAGWGGNQLFVLKIE